MARGEQIDKLSKQYVILSGKEVKFAKREHKRYMRRLRKDVSKPNPMHNRYGGWIG